VSPIGAKRLDTWEVSAAEAPVDGRHSVASSHSRLHHSPADEMGAAEDKESHKSILSAGPAVGYVGSPRAQRHIDR
jgi:hypothetical protein